MGCALKQLPAAMVRQRDDLGDDLTCLKSAEGAHLGAFVFYGFVGNYSHGNWEVLSYWCKQLGQLLVVASCIVFS